MKCGFKNAAEIISVIFIIVKVSDFIVSAAKIQQKRVYSFYIFFIFFFLFQNIKKMNFVYLWYSKQKILHVSETLMTTKKKWKWRVVKMKPSILIFIILIYCKWTLKLSHLEVNVEVFQWFFFLLPLFFLSFVSKGWTKQNHFFLPSFSFGRHSLNFNFSTSNFLFESLWTQVALILCRYLCHLATKQWF